MMEISFEDVEFLKQEYKQARKEALTEPEAGLKMYHKGMAKGLEVALVRIGVSNDEMDKLALEAYNESQG